MYTFILGGIKMAISNKKKRELTCKFCPKLKPGCKCKKFWKTIYLENREEILKIYSSSEKK